MLTKKSKKLMRDYLDALPLTKERKGSTTYWFLPETDSEEWIAFIDEIVCRVVTEVKVVEHPRFGPEIATYHAEPLNDYETFKDAVNHDSVWQAKFMKTDAEDNSENTAVKVYHIHRAMGKPY